MIRNKDAKVDLRIFSIVSALFRYMVIKIVVHNRATHAISKSGKYPVLDNLLLIFLLNMDINNGTLINDIPV